MRNRATGFLMIVLAGAGAVAATAQAQSLEDALVMAHRNNPALQAARARLSAAQEDIEQVLAQALPRVDLSVRGYDWENVDRGSPQRDSSKSDVLNQISVKQTLRAGMNIVPAIKAAKFIVRSNRAQLSSVEQNVLFDAATAYADVIRDQAVLELNQSNEKVHERQLEATRDRFNVGEVTRTDVSLAESRLSRARAERIAAEGRLTEARASFENAIGQPAGAVSQPRPLADLPANRQEALAQARSNNFDVIRARALTEAARQRVENVDREQWPSLSLTSEYSFDDNFQGGSDRRRASIMLGFSMPLYTSGSIQSRLRQARQVVTQNREETRQQVQSVVEATTAAWQMLQVARAQIDAFTALVKAGEIALAGVREEAAVGSRTVLDVLDAEQELLDARVSMVRAQRDEIVATFRLRRFVGSLTARQLGLAVQ